MNDLAARANPLGRFDSSTKLTSKTKSVSFVLLNYRRPANVAKIIAFLETFDWIDEIIVWDNSENRQLYVELSKVLTTRAITIVPAFKNFMTYGRYLACKLARNPLIGTMDDDWLPTKESFEEAYQSFIADTDQIVACLKPGHMAYEQDKKYVSLGWGSFWRIDKLQVFTDYRLEFNEDEMLLRKADKVFSILNRPKFIRRIAHGVDLPGALGDEALSLRKDHWFLNVEILKRCNVVMGVG